MPSIDETTIREIVSSVIATIRADQPSRPDAPPQYHEGVFSSVTEAVDKAKTAFVQSAELSLELRKEIIGEIRSRFTEQAEHFATLTLEETKLGRTADKIAKIKLAAGKTPGTEDLTPTARSDDNGLCLTERAPYGVIGSIPPVTNPVETIVNNGIGMFAGGNTVVFNPHPGAKRVSVAAVGLLNSIVKKRCGLTNAFTCAAEPTIEGAKALMRHPEVSLLVVTGGPGVVKEAMQSGKKVIAAGPGNPPVVVDEGIDVEKAVRDIIFGASFDNNIICCEEKQVFVASGVYDEFIRRMKAEPVVLLNEYQTQRLMQKVFTDGHPNKSFVGKNANVLLSEIGIHESDQIRLAVCEVDGGHPLVMEEQMMPFLPIVKVRDVEQGMALAKASERGCYHSSYMHSLNVANLHKMARLMNTVIFVKNGSSPNGLGYQTAMHTSWTIAGKTGEGVTTARTFTRERNCVLKGYFRIV